MASSGHVCKGNWHGMEYYECIAAYKVQVQILSMIKVVYSKTIVNYHRMPQEDMTVCPVEV